MSYATRKRSSRKASLLKRILAYPMSLGQRERRNFHAKFSRLIPLLRQHRSFFGN